MCIRDSYNIVLYILPGRARNAMPSPALGLRQVDAAEQQHQFLVAENYFRFLARGFRPSEPALFQTLGADP